MGKDKGNRDDPGDDVRIKKIVFDHSEKLAVASFQSLGVLSARNLPDISADLFGIKAGVLRPGEETRMRKILAMEVPVKGKRTFRYEGSTPYESDDGFATFAAIVDEDTGEATLYPTDVFHMMPRSSGYGDHPWRLRMDLPHNKEVEEEDPNLDEKAKKEAEALEKRLNAAELAETFGTAARRRRNKQMNENRNIETPSVGFEIDQLKEAATNEKKPANDRIPGDDTGILPPMNIVDPETPYDVVDADDLLPPHLARLILSIPDVQKIIDRDEEQFAEWRKTEAFPKWFLSALKTFSLDEERRKKQVTLSYFAMMLYTLFKSKSDAIRKRNASLPESWPNPLIHHLLDKFTQTNRSMGRSNRVMPMVLKDKALIHAMFTLLIANDFCFAAGEFFAQLPGVNASRIQNLCLLGRLASYSRDGVRWIDLRTPLPEFKIKEKPDRKRRL